MVFMWRDGGRIIHTLRVRVLEAVALLRYNKKRPKLVFLTRDEVEAIIHDTGEREKRERERERVRNNELVDLTPGKKANKLYFFDYWTELGELLGQDGRMVLTNDHPPTTVQDAIKDAVVEIDRLKDQRKTSTR